MVEHITSGHRTARKEHRCSLCGAIILPGTRYSFQVNVFDGYIYTFKDCAGCGRDGVLNRVFAWLGGADEGANAEAAYEWAHDAALYAESIPERWAARNWLARSAGGE